MGLLTRDHSAGRAAARALGIGGDDDYEALSTLLTFRSSTSRAALGSRMSAEERRALKARFEGLGAQVVNRFPNPNPNPDPNPDPNPNP